jgi:pimeloyl-ACP methyl ester carboxylesterase
MRYSTSEMAKDIIEVLDHIKWTEERSIHVVGVSMGGMISQELALRIPERITSLTLVSTGRRIYNTVVSYVTKRNEFISNLEKGFFENMYNRAMLFVPHSVDHTLNRIKYNMHSDEFLEKPDESEYVVEPFPTNGDRCMAVELFKRLDPFFYPKYVFFYYILSSTLTK